MKKDQYIPHEVSMRTTSEVMKLIEKEGMTGYGIYWALMEYLRVQDDYTGDVRILKTLARQLKTKLSKVESVLHNYGLFTLTDFTFRSTKLDTMMKPLEDKRKAMSKRNVSKLEAERKQSDSKVETECKQAACNSLETSRDISLSKVKESKVKESITSSSKEEEGDAVDGVASTSVTLAWERYVDQLADEQQWIEIMAMRSGLGLVFVKRFTEVLQHFKRHIQAVGNEKDIQSPGDAKRYFCFYNTPGSTPFRQLVDELQKPIDKGKYKHEDYDAATGQRSYCGVPIPADAPPRPNGQAVWCDGTWVF